MDAFNWLDELKFRLSWGKVGNVLSINPYGTSVYLSQQNAVFNEKVVAGYTFANAAEIMQTYEGWSANDIADFKTWIVNVFASKNKDFLDNHQGTNNCSLHYWSNWDLVNMCSYLAIGILTENNDMVNFVVNYFYSGVGNGCISNLIQACLLYTSPSPRDA